MKIVEMRFEIVRATPAVAEFLVYVHLDCPTTDCEVLGRAVGPRSPGVSTVEVAYPMAVKERARDAITLRCVVPEPNLWSPGTPFEYVVSVTLKVGGESMDSRTGTLILRGAA